MPSGEYLRIDSEVIPHREKMIPMVAKREAHREFMLIEQYIKDMGLKGWMVWAAPESVEAMKILHKYGARIHRIWWKKEY